MQFPRAQAVSWMSYFCRAIVLALERMVFGVRLPLRSLQRSFDVGVVQPHFSSSGWRSVLKQRDKLFAKLWCCPSHARHDR